MTDCQLSESLMIRLTAFEPPNGTRVQIARHTCELRHLVLERHKLENGEPRSGGQAAGVEHDGRRGSSGSGRVRLSEGEGAPCLSVWNEGR